MLYIAEALESRTSPAVVALSVPDDSTHRGSYCTFCSLHMTRANCDQPLNCLFYSSVHTSPCLTPKLKHAHTRQRVPTLGPCPSSACAAATNPARCPNTPTRTPGLLLNTLRKTLALCPTIPPKISARSRPTPWAPRIPLVARGPRARCPARDRHQAASRNIMQRTRCRVLTRTTSSPLSRGKITHKTN